MTGPSRQHTRYMSREILQELSYDSDQMLACGCAAGANVLRRYPNDEGKEINFNIQQKLSTAATTYTSIDTCLNEEEATNYPVELLYSLNPNGIPQHTKVGCPIMLLRNTEPPRMCNRTRLVVNENEKLNLRSMTAGLQILVGYKLANICLLLILHSRIASLAAEPIFAPR